MSTLASPDLAPRVPMAARLTAPSGGLGQALLQGLAGALGVLVLWQALAWGLAGRWLVANPAEVAAHLWQNAGLIGRATAVTLDNALWGFVAGNLAAVALAVLIALAPRAQGVISAVALVVFCLPLVATGPILRVLFGPGDGPQITVAALAVFFTTLLPLLVGLRAAPSAWFDLIQLYGRGAGVVLVTIRLRTALPYLLAGLQIAAPAAVLGAMVGEFTGAEQGLGVLALRAMRGIDVPATWALAVVTSGVSILAYAGLGVLSRLVVRERPEILLAAPAMAEAATGWRRGLVTGLLSLVIVVVLWWGLMEAFALNRFFAKRPDDLWFALTSGPQAAMLRAELTSAALQTLAMVVPGWLAGVALGAGLALGLALAPGLAAGVMPLAIALRAVPILTTAPLIALALGRGPAGAISIVAVMTFFPVLVACLHGLRQAPGAVLDLLALYSAPRWRVLVEARLPAMLPAFFAAARLSVPAAVLAVTVTEWLATGRGLGNLMALTASTSNYALLWASVVLVALGSALGYALVGGLAERVLARLAPEQMQR